MNSKNDPDLFSDEYSKVRDYVLTPHFKLLWLLNKSWVTNIRLEGSAYYHDKLSKAHEYNSYGSSQPSVHYAEEGYSLADALPLTFYSDLVEDSRELDYSLGLHYNWLKHWGKVKRFFRNLVEAQVAEDHFSFEQVKRCSPKHYSLYSF